MDGDTISLDSQTKSVQDVLEAEKNTPEICLRCSKVIEHVPYKYKGHRFHAVCIICNFCGKKLVAKPFDIDGSKIFCSDQCKKNFDNAAAVTTEPIPSPIKEKSNSLEEPLDEGESLMEVLEKIQEGSEEMPPRKSSPLNKGHDPDRLTDYPRVQSPDHNSQSPINGSRRSSLSAVSESSFTSEGSSIHSHDTNKLPKKILKNPNRLQRRSKRNRVRWKLPENEDSDTSSLKSFDSMSTASEIIFSQARSGISEVRLNWREFERYPPHGSTGLTPAKPQRSYSARFNSPSSGLPSNFLSQPLLGGSLVPHSSYFASSIPQVQLNGEPIFNYNHQTSLRRVLSPLANSTAVSPGSSSKQILQSTPKDHHQSNSSPLKMKAKEFTGTADDIDMPILRFDNSNLTDLEESTVEDRLKSHIFQFPQKTPIKCMGIIPGPSNRSLTGKGFLEDDDADDYDHLSPIKKTNKMHFSSKKGSAINEQSWLKNKQMAVNHKDVIKNEDGCTRTSDTSHLAKTPLLFPLMVLDAPKGRSTAGDLSSAEEPPPPLPPRVRVTETYSYRDEGKSLAIQEDKPLPLPVEEDIGKLKWIVNEADLACPLERFTPVEGRTGAVTGRDSEVKANHKMAEERINNLVPMRERTENTNVHNRLENKVEEPPPVPPKTRHHNRDKNSNPLPIHDRLAYHSPEEDIANLIDKLPPPITDEIQSTLLENILPPPPEFAISSLDSVEDSEVRRAGWTTPPSDEILTSISNSTLVPDPEESLDSKITLETGEEDGSCLSPPSCKKNQPFLWSAFHYKDKADSLPLSNSTDKPDPKMEHLYLRDWHSEPTKSPVDVNNSGRDKERVFTSSQTSNSLNITRFGTETVLMKESSIKQPLSTSSLLPLTQLPSLSSYRQSHGKDISQFARRVPNRPPPPPPLRRVQSAKNSGREEHLMVQMLHSSNSKPQMMKPVVHDTEKHIREMLAEIENEESKAKQQQISYGTCGKCVKSIQMRKDLCTHDGLCYHAKCYRCKLCNISLQGKKVYRVRTTLLCRDCFPKFDIPSVNSGNNRRTFQISTFHPQDPYHSSSSGLPSSGHGGQVTSV